MKIFRLFTTLFAISTLVGCAPKNITIEWDESSCHFVTSGGYARIKKVDKVAFSLRNERINEPFGIYSLALEYTENGNYKG